MKKIIEKFVTKYILKILIIYKNSLENNKLEFKNYLEQTIYWELDYLIKMVKKIEEEFK